MTQQKAKNILRPVMDLIEQEYGYDMGYPERLEKDTLRQLCEAILDIVGEDEPSSPRKAYKRIDDWTFAENLKSIRNQLRAELRLKIQRFFGQLEQDMGKANGTNEEEA